MKSESKGSIFNLKDRESFKLFFESYYASLCLFANNFLKDMEVSQDITQDAFIYIWNKRENFFSESSVKSYLYKHVKDRCLNYLRNNNLKRGIEISKMETEILFRDSLVEEETYKIIFDAISNLPPQGQNVIELSLDGMKNQEIAEKLNISINTVKTIKKRAFAALRLELKDNIFN